MNELDAQIVDDRLLERDIQNFLAKNLQLLGRKLTLVGIEHEVPFGRIDILAVDDDFNHTVIEIKRGTATRDAIGQIQSYMGAVRRLFPDSRVEGILVARQLDQGAEAALLACVNVSFIRFEVEFRFHAASVAESSQSSLWSATTSSQSSSPTTQLNVADAWPKTGA